MSEDLYKILEVSKTASEADIRKSYKKLVMKHHPDKNKGDKECERKFQQISEAYEVLNDPEKRKMYDQYGLEGLRGNGPGGFDPFSMFRRQANQKRKCHPIQVNIAVTLEQIYAKTNIEKTILVNKLCSSCEGTGTSDKSKISSCDGCNGRGVKITTKQIGPGMVQQFQTVCTECKGDGKTIPEEYKCVECKGNRIIKEEKVIGITIDADTKGQIILQNQGNEQPGVLRGDIIVSLHAKPHELFTRKNNDLFMEKTINLSEALLGTCFVIEQLDKRKINIELHDITEPGSVKKLVNEGIPQGKGDLYIKFDVEFPKSCKKDSNLEDTLGLYTKSRDENTEYKYLLDTETLEDNEEEVQQEKVECAQQ